MVYLLLVAFRFVDDVSWCTRAYDRIVFLRVPLCSRCPGLFSPQGVSTQRGIRIAADVAAENDLVDLRVHLDSAEIKISLDRYRKLCNEVDVNIC